MAASRAACTSAGVRAARAGLGLGAAVLRVARQHYDYVLLDVGRQIDAVSLRALDVTDTIYPVLQLALPDIRDARRLLDIFRSLGYVLDNIRLIVNRYEKGGKLVELPSSAPGALAGVQVKIRCGLSSARL